MITYAEINGTTLIQYPFGLAQLQVENPFTNYSSSVNLATIYPQTDSAKKTGNATGYDCYSYTILKTGSAAYIVLASQVQF